jgi:two-component system sensor kinase FixL
MLLASSRFFPPPPRNLSDREYFTRLRAGQRRVFGAPVINRGTNTWAFHLAQRIEDAEGRFIGAEVAAIELAFFQNIYASLRLGRDATVTLLRNDATLLVRQPPVEGSVGQQYAATPQARLVLGSDDGAVLRLTSTIDGRERLLVSRALPGFPLRINVSFGVDAVLAEWRAVAWRMSAGGLLLLGLVGIAGVAVRRAASAQRLAARTQEQAAQAAQLHDARMRQLIEQLPVAVAVFDREMRYVAVSRVFIRDHPGALQLTPAAYVGRSHYDTILHRNDHWRLVHLRVLAGEAVHMDAEPYPQADGRPGWIRWRMAPWRGVDGSVGGATLFIEMVTGRVEAERALVASESRLRESEGILRLATEGARIGSYRKDARTGLLHVTPGTRRLQGLPEGSGPITTAEWRRGILPEDLAAIDDILARIRAERPPGIRYDYRLRSPEDGSLRFIEARARVEYDAAGKPVASLGVIIDVTEKIQAAEAVRASEERLRLTLEATGEGLWDWDVPSGRMLFSDRWQTMLGHEPGELAPAIATWFGLMHPEDRDRAERALHAHIAGETQLYACELRMRHRQGHWVWVLDRGKVVERDAEGRPVRVLGTRQDIARRKAAEEALAAREAELRAVLDTVPECVKVIAQDGAIFTMNRAGLRMVGAEHQAQAVGCQVTDFLSAADGPAWDDLHARVCAGESATLEYQCCALDGQHRTLETRSVPVDIPGLGRAHLSVARDVTALRQAEREVRALQVNAMKAARVSAVGAMAAGLAHELNQPLAAVANFTGAARLLLDARPAGPDREQVVRMLEGAAEQAVRAGEIVRRLRDYIRGTDIDLQAVGARRLIEEAIASTRATLGAEAAGALVPEVAADAGDVFADPVQVQQIFANLIRNAVEATRGQPDRRIAVGALRSEDGHGAEFFVADTGPGLSAEAARRAFEAFNSTKPSGLGVGLAICRAIVDAHGGRMWVGSMPGYGGACFRFILPDVTTLIRGGGA